MDLKQLSHFRIAARYRSFSQAAAAAYISQQGLSKSIQSLEQSLGVPLFTRTSGGVALTPQGEYLAKRCEYLFRYLQDTEEELRRFPAGGVGADTLLSVTAGACALFPVGVLERAPGLRVRERSEEQCEGDVLSGVVHAAVSSRPLREEGLRVRPLLEAPLCLFLHRDHPLAQQERVALSDLSGGVLMLLSTLEQSNQALLNRLEAEDIPLSEVRRVPTLLSVFSACAPDSGFAVFIRALGERISAPHICARPLVGPGLTWGLCFLTRQEEPPQAEGLYRRLRDTLEKSSEFALDFNT